METLLPWLLIAAGLVLLYFGGEWLVKGASRLALRLGVTPLVVGLTVVAFGTSTPELFVSLKATLVGQGDIALGNVVGSNIANIGLILGICAMVFPLSVAVQVLRVDMPIVVATGLAFIAFLWDGVIARWEAGLLAAVLLGYIFLVLRLARRERKAAVQAEYTGALPPPSGAWWGDALFLAAGLVVLAIGARCLVSGAVDVARALGVSEAVIGLTIVAVGTSLPELSASFVAALRKEGDIAIGNIVGSSLFNTLGITGVAGLVRPLEAHGVGLTDAVVMVGLALVLLPFMRSDFSVRRGEGAVLLVAYVGYLAWIVANARA